MISKLAERIKQHGYTTILNKDLELRGEIPIKTASIDDCVNSIITKMAANRRNQTNIIKGLIAYRSVNE